MHLWSRGLGRRVVSIDVNKLGACTVDEALKDLPKTVRKNIKGEISEKSLALVGGKVEPVKWDFVITIDWNDLKGLLQLILSDIPKKKAEGEI